MMSQKNHTLFVKAMAILGLLLMVFIVHHAIDTDHHADHNNCPLCLSLTGLVIIAAFILVFFVTPLFFQSQSESSAVVSADIDSPHKRGPPQS